MIHDPPHDPPLPPSVTDRDRVTALRAYGVLDTPPEPAFDDLVALAAHVCGTPVALVTLVEADRQWFKARIGTDLCGTGIHGSICGHALDSGDLLVIPDLTADPRTADGPLVTGASRLRFYAGAPLRSPEGQGLGTLCVMDTVPRPAGLTAIQARSLHTLARQVMGLMELRRAIHGQDQDQDQDHNPEAERLRIGVAQWQGLFDGLQEGFVVAEALRDAAGTIRDWRYLDVNPAWSRLMGVTRAAAIGHTVQEAGPEIGVPWLLEFARVVDRREALTVTHQLGLARRWYEARAFPLEGDRFAVTMMEVTARILADTRRDALLELNDTLRALDDAPAIIRAASATVARVLGLSRAGLAHLDEDGEHVVVEAEWVAGDLVSAIGPHRLAEYGQIGPALRATVPLVIEDVLTDPRTREAAGRYLALGTRALVSMPVVAPGRPPTTFFAHAAAPRTWSADALAFLRTVSDRVELAVARVKADADQMLQNTELSHRLKNTLAMVQAIARQTMRGATDQHAVAVFTERLQTLSQAHQVLLERNWTTSPIATVVGSVLGRLGLDRFDVSGADMPIGPRATLSLSLVLHELATNALKYGALSSEQGRVAVTWHVEPDAAGPTLVVRWTERGGPAPASPAVKGFGTRLIASGLVGAGGVSTRYPESGFEAELRSPLRHVQEY